MIAVLVTIVLILPVKDQRRFDLHDWGVYQVCCDRPCTDAVCNQFNRDKSCLVRLGDWILLFKEFHHK